MADLGTPAQTLAAWVEIPARIETTIRGLTEDELNLKDADGLSIREKVHHLVEANIVAAGIVIAAIGSGGCTYDWSWLYPDAKWTRRMGYGALPIDPAIETLKALSRYVAIIIAANHNAPQQELKLLDVPGSEPRPTTVNAVLEEEVKHTDMHLGEAEQIRKRHQR